MRQTYFKVAEYPLLCLILMWGLQDAFDQLILYCNRIWPILFSDKTAWAYVITFSIVAILHFILNILAYFGREKPVEIMMLCVNAVLMLIGCNALYQIDGIWKLPVILITAALFFANSGKLLVMHKYMGYYIAFKYTVLVVCILSSFDVVNFVISIALLLFAIGSIVVGFYRNTVTFRLYGLVLSMLSIIKLILIDIKYDSTLENAVSFFVCGILCFVISFIYHKIDISFRRNNIGS